MTDNERPELARTRASVALLVDDLETPTQAASRFAGAGMRVFPVDMRPQRHKQPIYGYAWKQRATSDLREVVEDFTDAEVQIGTEFVGVGWALGLNNKFAVDLDGCEPEWWGEVAEAAVNVTKRGEHRVFENPPGRRIGNGTSRFPGRGGWGEVRGAGGYVVIWWSDRPGFDVAELEKIGQFPHLEWLTDAGDEADAVSPAVLEKFKATHTDGHAGRIKGFETALAARVPGSSRNHHATTVACWIAREAAAGLVPAREALGALETWWAEMAQTAELDAEGNLKTRALTRREILRCECWAVGQLTDERVAETRDKAAAEESAYREAEQKGLNDLVGASSDDDRASGEKADDDGASSFERVDLGPYLDGGVVQVVADMLAMTDGRALIHQARLNGVHGDSGTGKGWLVVYLLREQLDAGNTIMVIDLEDTPQPTIERLRQIGVDDEAIRKQVVFIRPDEAFTFLNVERLIAQIGEFGVTHVILDSLGEAFSLEGLNEDRDVEVAPWLRRVCRRIIDRTGAGVTLIDHGTKSAEKPLDPSGSKRKRAAITGTAWLMTSTTPFDRDSGGVAQLRCAKDRHGWFKRGDTVAALVMGAVDPITGQSPLRLDPQTPAAKPPVSVDLDCVVAVLDDAYPTWMSKRAVVAEVRRRGTKMSETRLYGAIDLAVVRGEAEARTGPRRAVEVRAAKTP